MGKVFGGGIVAIVLWLAVAVLFGWLFSTMVGVVIAIGWGAAAAAKWYAFPWILRILIGAVGSEVVVPVWLVAIILSIFLTLPLFAH